jgi:type IV secretory pathway ATPase VirB11/archaellum biosynthesis ATPase
MNKELSLDGNIVTVLMGRQCYATYINPEVPIYKNNPLIEALPAINTFEEVGRSILHLPEYSNSEREIPPEKRIHYVEQIRDYMQPLPIHLKIESTISIMIRRGYIGRNPLSPFYARQFSVGIKDILDTKLNTEGKNLIGNQSTAKSYTVIGISGIGKTTAIEKVLLMYPQVIVHTDYKANDLVLGYLKQIVWLKLECPFNGSRKSLCQQFF